MTEINLFSEPLDLDVDAAELQLQQELKDMFAIDTQKYLQAYINLVKNLKSQSWSADIQELYRCIHTIKGGAVTVGADAILHVATALEELLSDLRYLQIAPPLEDGFLAQSLLEGGELLTASLEINTTAREALTSVSPTLERLNLMRQTIHSQYLPESNERTQLFQEFAEQGFDLVVLDLEMALEKLPSSGQVSVEALEIAQRTIQQLLEIGKNLEFETGWSELLAFSKILFSHQENNYWQEKWPLFLQIVKNAARNGGIFSNPLKEKSEITQSNLIQTPSTVVPLIQRNNSPNIQSKTETETLSTNSKASPQTTSSHTNTQIPVSLERLDQSAQYLVETLLSARVSQGHYKTLQSQLLQLIALAQENVQYITKLRQFQDDYVLLDNLQTNASTAPVIERYRQGYTIINRLLESSLRLSELGGEATTTSRQTQESLQNLDQNILNLQQTVEESRLIPFKNVAFRARGILRDLTNRYAKPVKLIVQGEDLELDVGTIQKLEPAILHLLRNAYDHGIESPEERLSKGKNEEGIVNLSLRRIGNYYLLEIKDNGRGIDAKQIEKIAYSKQMPQTRTDTAVDLLQVICQPGFTSQTYATEISGRGVGMDVVASQIASLGGYLSLETTPSVGTTFRMQIPVPRLLVRCLLVRSGDRIFAIPSDQIINTTLKSDLSITFIDQLHQDYSYLIQENDQSIPGLDLRHYWENTTSKNQLSDDTAVCLRIRSLSLASLNSQKQAWLLADELLEQMDLLINPLPHPLIPPVGLMGVSLQNDGKLISVLEPASIVEKLWSKSKTNIQQTIHSLSPVKPIKTQKTNAPNSILVVDDAALLRRRLEVSLTNNGYKVYTCQDGLEAWNWLLTNPHPSMIITDIEMPVMDGFTLINRCRQEGINIPIMVISSRLSEEWSKEAQRVGATDYLTKGFTTADLLHKVKNALHKSSSSLFSK